MIGAYIKGIGQLSDPKARAVVWKALGLGVLVFAALWAALWMVIQHTTLFATGWLETASDVLGGGLGLVLTFLLFPAVASTFIGLLLDEICDAVEARHYPGLGPDRDIPVAETLMGSLKFLGVMVVLNILMLPFLFLGPLFPFVFYAVNGYLLSREYFELVAHRRVGPAEAQALRKAHQGTVFMAGVVAAFLLTVPVVNLLAPIVAVAATVHLFQAWRAGRA